MSTTLADKAFSCMSHILGSNTVTKEILSIRTHKKYRHKHLVVMPFFVLKGKKEEKKTKKKKQTDMLREVYFLLVDKNLSSPFSTPADQWHN